MRKLVSHFIKSCLLLLLLVITGCATSPGLVTATREHRVAKVELMLKNGADPNVRDLEENYGRAPLYYAAENGYNDLIVKLLAAGANVNQTSSEGWTPLMVASRYQGNPETIHLLVKAGANLYASNRYGWNPLLLAIYGNKTEVVKTLIDYGLSPDHRNSENMDAYDIAQKQKNSVTQEMIRQYRENYLQKQKTAEIEKQAKVIEQRDTALPPSLKYDKYLIAYTDALKNENYTDAVLYAGLLDKLEMSPEDDLYYFWGQALVKLNSPQSAKEKLNEYIKRAGSQGKYYTQALRLIIQMEK